MHDSFDIARRDINRDALLEAIGGCLRVEHGPVEESLPGRLAALLDQLQNLLSQETEYGHSSRRARTKMPSGPTASARVSSESKLGLSTE
jgi:hypothetical protein